MASSQIITNTGTNYTLYYNVLNYFKTIMSNHPSVGVATYGDITALDTKQFPAYPIANVNFLNTTFGTSTTDFTVQLIVADKVKNKNNESDGRNNEQILPFFGIDDSVDIYANTLAILNDLTSYTQRGLTNFDINGDITCEPFSDDFSNGLSGWVSTFTLTTHNDKNRCLFFLVKGEEAQAYLIENCQTGERYVALLSESTFPIGGVFASRINPNGSNDYSNLVCYIVIEAVDDTDYDFVNLPVLPPGNVVNCPTCNLWINPKVWITTPAKWNNEYRTWITD